MVDHLVASTLWLLAAIFGFVVIGTLHARLYVLWMGRSDASRRAELAPQSSTPSAPFQGVSH